MINDISLNGYGINEVKPFLKWAGGKSQLLVEITQEMPSKFNRFFEPFVGAGAVFFCLKHKKTFINDINKALINCYCQIRDNPNKLIEYITELDNNEINGGYYIKIRNKYNYNLKNEIYDVETAGLFIWLNKHCFNGLYRVNSKGCFNVPYSGGKSKSINPLNIKLIGSYLRQVKISNLDFEEFLKNCCAKDFVYFDPPYAPESNTANFTSYTENSFSMDDQLRVFDCFKQLSSKKVFCMLSNSNTEFCRNLYKDYRIKIVHVKRAINSKSNHRFSSELIVTNY